jgi:hemoglobin-like flavoprotein
LAPGSISMFGFGEGVDERNLPETLFKLSAFQNHTSRVVAMLETALVMMIGNDMDSLAKALSDLGCKHIVYGVQPAHYLVVESALIRTLQLKLKDQWTVSMKKDWAAVFKFIARAMMLGAENRVEIVKATRRNAEHQKVATLRLKAISASKRTKALTRNSRSGRSRFEGEKKSKLRRYSSDPPKRPVRGSASRGMVCLAELYDEGGHELGAGDLMHSETRTNSSMMGRESHDWYWGDSSIEPPKIPQRSPLIIRNESFDSVSSVDSKDKVPRIPRRTLSPPRIPRRALSPLHSCRATLKQLVL